MKDVLIFPCNAMYLLPSKDLCFTEREKEHGLEMFFWFHSLFQNYFNINNNNNTFLFGAASIMFFNVVNTAVTDFGTAACKISRKLCISEEQNFIQCIFEYGKVGDGRSALEHETTQDLYLCFIPAEHVTHKY